MKIAHLCLAGSFNDNWGYQDNLLPRYHKKNGHDVVVITSTLVDNKERGGFDEVNATEYVLSDGVRVVRIPFRTSMPKVVAVRLRVYSGLFDQLEAERPDFIFVHGPQFLGAFELARYLRKHHHTKVVVDSHADLSNSARNFISRYILHRVVWRRCAQVLEPYVTKFFGVLPARVSFLVDMYGTPPEKTDLLVLGADTDELRSFDHSKARADIRLKHGIGAEDFLIVTGGKINESKKQTLLLMRAVQSMRPGVRLLIFGSVSTDMKEEFLSLVDGARVKFVGWIKASDVYKYFVAADLAVFPGRHSVLWEQAVGAGLPCVFRHWEGATHVDVGGNCLFLYKDSIDEIYDAIMAIVEDEGLYHRMRTVAVDLGVSIFSYDNIAKKCIAL